MKHFIFSFCILMLTSLNTQAQTTVLAEEPPVLKPNDLDIDNPEAVINKDHKTNKPAAEVKPEVKPESKPEPKKEVQEVKDTNEKIHTQHQFEPGSYAQQFSILGDVAPLSMWVPYKLGATFAWRFHQEWAVEASALRGKIDLEDSGVDEVGEATENRFDVIVRKYFGSTFSVFAGYSYQKVGAELSDETQSSNPGLPFYDTEIKTHGIIAGIGNRWVWGQGFTFGVDWISAILPLSSSVKNDFRNVDIGDYGSSQEASDVRDAMDKIEETPRVTLLHLRLGWTF